MEPEPDSGNPLSVPWTVRGAGEGKGWPPSTGVAMRSNVRIAVVGDAEVRIIPPTQRVSPTFGWRPIHNNSSTHPCDPTCAAALPLPCCCHTRARAAGRQDVSDPHAGHGALLGDEAAVRDEGGTYRCRCSPPHAAAPRPKGACQWTPRDAARVGFPLRISGWRFSHC